MRKIKIVPGEYYHIYNRGNNKQNIFIEQRDWIRFLFSVIYFQSPINFPQIGRSALHHVVQSSALDILNVKKNTIMKILATRYVELINFTLMPNHFHLAVREKKENGISQYMHRTLTAYTKYFNLKYDRTGHLFQGPFQIVHIEDNEQLLYLSTYMHRNPREINQWKNKEHLYPWSSYQDYIGENRWGKLLNPKIILDQFSNPQEYTQFVKTSPAKSELDKKYLFE